MFECGTALKFRVDRLLRAAKSTVPSWSAPVNVPASARAGARVPADWWARAWRPADSAIGARRSGGGRRDVVGAARAGGGAVTAVGALNCGISSFVRIASITASVDSITAAAAASGQRRRAGAAQQHRPASHQLHALLPPISTHARTPTGVRPARHLLADSDRSARASPLGESSRRLYSRSILTAMPPLPSAVCSSHSAAGS